jgi:hypothetical protein
MRLSALVAVLLFALPVFADDQGGVALDYSLKRAIVGLRLMNNGVDLGLNIPFRKYQSFVLDFETDRTVGQTTMSPAVGYQLGVTIKWFQPYAYFNVGASATSHQGMTFNSTIGQGLDVRITSRYGLRFEHEFDWSKQAVNRWDQRYTALFVIHFGRR